MPDEIKTGSLPPDALPEVNDNVSSPEPSSPSSTLSLDVVEGNKPAPELKLPTEKSDYEPTKEPKLTKEQALKKQQEELAKEAAAKKEKKTSNEPKETKKDLEAENENEDTSEDVEGGENKSTESEEETSEDGETTEEPTEEELKLHGNTKRDYTGFNANQVKILKKLDNSRFQAISTEWRALQSAAGKAVNLAQELEQQKKIAAGNGIPSSWYDHPEAYTLAPEFRQISQQYNQFAALEDHWQQQLAAVHDGKEWMGVTGINPQTGELVYTPPQPASPAAIAYLTKALNQAITGRTNLEARSQVLQQTFQQTHKQAAEGIKKEVDDIFSKIHPDIKPQEKDEEIVKQALPKIYRDHPLTYGYVKLGALILAQGRRLNQLYSEKQNVAKIEADKKLAGARSNKPKVDPAASNKNGGKKVFSLDSILGES